MNDVAKKFKTFQDESAVTGNVTERKSEDLHELDR